MTDVYHQLSGFADVLLVVPSLLLLGAAARFTAARRARRLAGLKLAGAAPGQITGIETVEALIGAAAGAVLGLGLALVGRELVAGIPLAGGPFGTAALTIPWSQVVVAMIVAVVATLTGLRAVRISPLGVVRPGSHRPPGLWRVLALLVVIVLWSSQPRQSAPGPRLSC